MCVVEMVWSWLGEELRFEVGFGFFPLFGDIHEDGGD